MCSHVTSRSHRYVPFSLSCASFPTPRHAYINATLANRCMCMYVSMCVPLIVLAAVCLCESYLAQCFSGVHKKRDLYESPLLRLIFKTSQTQSKNNEYGRWRVNQARARTFTSSKQINHNQGRQPSTNNVSNENIERENESARSLFEYAVEYNSGYHFARVR